MTTPAPPVTIDNYGPNDPNAPVDNFPPSFPHGRALPSAMLNQLTFAEVNQGSFHAQAPNGEVASTWTINEWDELRESRRIINDEWVCFFEYPRRKWCSVRCVLRRTDSSFNEVWYHGSVRDQQLELALVIPSGREVVQDVELHLKGATTLQHKWHDREFARFVPGKGQLERAMVHVEKPSLGNENMRTETAVLTNGVVMIKYTDGLGKTTTHLRYDHGEMCIFASADHKLRLQAPKGGPDAWGTIVYFYKVAHSKLDFEDRELMRDGTWKMAPGRQPPRDTRPNERKRPFEETQLTQEECEEAEEQAEQEMEEDVTAEEDRRAADYEYDMDGRDAFDQANC
jgi:hypothetical protein